MGCYSLLYRHRNEALARGCEEVVTLIAFSVRRGALKIRYSRVVAAAVPVTVPEFLSIALTACCFDVVSTPAKGDDLNASSSTHVVSKYGGKRKVVHCFDNCNGIRLLATLSRNTRASRASRRLFQRQDCLDSPKIVADLVRDGDPVQARGRPSQAVPEASKIKPFFEIGSVPIGLRYKKQK